MQNDERYRRLVESLYALRRFGVRLGLDNIRELARRLGNPQEAFHAIHIAGTNGKGSVAAMVEAALRHAGLRTGLFTSPHLVSFTERIQIGRAPASEREVLDLYDEIRPHLESLADDTAFQPPTFFETTAALAFLAFRRAAVEWAVLETGLGGRLDATNLVTPRLCLITSIDFDHTAYLGETLEAIAAEKAGIFKPGVPAIALRQRPEVEDVLRRSAAECGAPLAFADPSIATPLAASAEGQTFRLRGRDWRLRLLGAHQVANATLALAAIDALRTQGVPIPDAAAAGALASVDWPGRFQIVRPDPLVVLDGAHNPAGASALATCFTQWTRGRPCNLVFSALADKAVDQMIAILAPLATWISVVPVPSSRSIRPEDLVGAFRSANPAAQVGTHADFASAWRALPAGPRPTLVTGSLFLVGEALALLGPPANKDWTA